MKSWGLVLGLLGLSIVVACAPKGSGGGHQSRYATVESLAHSNGFNVDITPGRHLSVLTFLKKPSQPSRYLMLYIEQDGVAWLNRGQISNDPTPHKPAVSLWAVNDQSSHAIAYMARPCHYIGVGGRTECQNPAVWDSARFSPEVIESLDDITSVLKKRAGAEKLVLFGHSGGATVAALLAARRDDVVAMVLVAGPLDHRSWTEDEGISSLRYSLNPSDYPAKLSPIPQLLLYGSDDSFVSEKPGRDYQTRLGSPTTLEFIVLPKDHQDFIDDWRDIHTRYVQPFLTRTLR